LGISEPELLEELKMCERVLPETLVGGGQK
jgi:hypothetical protein